MAQAQASLPVAACLSYVATSDRCAMGSGPSLEEEWPMGTTCYLKGKKCKTTTELRRDNKVKVTFEDGSQSPYIKVSKLTKPGEVNRSPSNLFKGGGFGTITLDEWADAFDKLDSNHDGKISRKEWLLHVGDSVLFDLLTRTGVPAVNRAAWMK